MKTIEFLIKYQDEIQMSVPNDIEISEFIDELEEQEEKLKKAQNYIVDLENQLKNKSNGWMNK